MSEPRQDLPQGHQVVVVGPDGTPIGVATEPPASGRKAEGGSAGRGDSVADMVEQPAKVMRIGTMVKQLLDEVKAAPLDDASRSRLREIHANSLRELGEGLAPELRDELDRLTLPFESETPSDAELRIAHAQLVGWLEGLFHGLQTALFAQQMAARVQLEQMQGRALPPGAAQRGAPGAGPQAPGGDGGGFGGGTGQYL
ncbi:MAG: bacterial proteasome activator family protein [Actinomycetota bacterium]|nr:bacterial proteasome activator family protein [Actinomycetota bacterium]